MRRRTVFGVVVALFVALMPGPAAAAGSASPDPIAHDPTIIKQGRYYNGSGAGPWNARSYSVCAS
ncbi:hypothetical protein [Phytohabitans kaempferiae]|uniref:Resuscitation-promoting factor core lysozyme-like domain-containing protein n=1 Tax=Phytohabitans kaempferiae TaxID=1620943 RepID=A0ABV6MH15_9ACTN